MKIRFALVVAGLIGEGASVVMARGATGNAAAHTWPPFVLVAGLLLIGVVANGDGIFASAAALLARIPGGGLPLYLAAMLLVAIVTVVLNLDTSVAFLTPVLVLVARRRGVGESRFLYGSVFMANAASLLLPGSNLTNLLVLADEHVSGSRFLARMWAPWTAAVFVTVVVVALAFPREGQDPAPSEAARDAPASRQLLSFLGLAAAVVLILSLADSALAVLGVGALLAALRIAQRRLEPRRVLDAVDPLSLLGVFLIAAALGTLAREWSYPGDLMMRASSLATAAIGAVAAVLVNNLPAAVLLGSRMPAHPRSLLIGLNVGPNLAVTGSLSALIWWRAARSVDARPSAIRYSFVGLLLVPATIAAALLALRVIAPGSL